MGPDRSPLTAIRRGRRFRRALGLTIGGIAALTVMIVSAGPAQAFTSTYVSGHHGYWQGSEGSNMCSKGNISTLQPYVSGTPSYPNSNQRILMIPRLDYSSNGTHWYTYKWGSWQARTVYGNQYARFGSQSLSVPTGGWYWRVAMDFRWEVRGLQVGRVVNVFNAGSDGWGEYWSGNGAATASNSSATFCLIY